MLLYLNRKSVIKNNLLILALTIGLLFTINRVIADVPTELLFKTESLYNQAQYQKVIETVDNILQTQKNVSESLLIRLYTYQAFAYVALDERDAALNTFRYLLIINPNLQLDPKFVSPKIIEIFEESKKLKGDSLKIKPVFVPIEELSQTSFREKIIRERAIRSLLYPGLGQIYDNKKTTGYLFLGAETVSLIGLVASHFLSNSAHQKYLDARTPLEIEDCYQSYAFWYRMRIGFCISSVGIWIFNYINATLAD